MSLPAPSSPSVTRAARVALGYDDAPSPTNSSSSEESEVASPLDTPTKRQLGTQTSALEAEIRELESRLSVVRLCPQSHVTPPSRLSTPSLISLHAEWQHEHIALRTLKSTWNARAPVSSLPPELLSAIFLHVRTAWTPTDTHSRGALGWTALSHACASWRALALGTPLLWAHIEVPHRRWVAALLARSRGAPLDVCAAFVPGRDPAAQRAVLALVLAHLPRVRTLRLSGCSSAVLRTFVEPASAGVPGALEASAAPLLQTLAVHCVDIFDAPHPAPAYALPVQLFAGVHPRLQSVAIAEWNVAWSALTFLDGVKRLALRLPTRPPRSRLLSILRRTPDLTNLDLTFAAPDPLRIDAAEADDADDLEEEEDARGVELKELRALHIEDDLASAAALLLDISAPHTAELSVRAHMAVGMADVPPGLRRALGAFAHTLERAGTHLARAHLYQDGLWVRIDAWAAACDEPDADAALDSAEDPPSAPALRLAFSSYAGPWARTHLLSALCALLPLAHARTVRFDAPLAWRGVAPRMPRVRTLLLGEENWDVVVLALGAEEAAVGAASDGEEEEVVEGESRREEESLRELRTVVLRRMGLWRTALCARFADWLARRARRGWGVREVRIEGCTGVVMSWVLALKENVDVVKWDGKGVCA